jgi:Outer membrane protein beta-barrel domain
MVKRINPAGLLACSLLLCFQAAAQTGGAAPKMAGAIERPPAQTPAAEEKNFEVGAHFSTLHYDDYGDYLTEPGIGGRVGYNFNDNFALEAEVNFYPRSHEGDPTVSGRKTLALFGVKAGVRRGRFGLFGKARPGFIYFSRRLEFACASEVEGDCSLENTNFAFDVGGVAEYRLSPRAFLRFDLGDTIMRSSIIGGYDTTHNLQFNAGVGFRF